MSIPKEEIEAIKQANDLISIIESKGMKLKKKGKNYVALCPFHEETTPSFTVDPVKQLWHCFGCPSNGQGSSGGDVISFIVKYDKITFQKAIEKLKIQIPVRAKGIDEDTKTLLPKQDKPKQDKPKQDKPKQDEPKQDNPRQDKPKQDEPRKESLSPKQQKLLNRVIQYYQGTLLKETKALEYLQKERGILNKQNILDFGAGFSSGSLLEAIPPEGGLVEELKLLGILNSKGHELFYGSIVFPSLTVIIMSLLSMAGGLKRGRASICICPAQKGGSLTGRLESAANP